MNRIRNDRGQRRVANALISIASIILTAAMLLSLAGCKSDTNDPAQTKEPEKLTPRSEASRVMDMIMWYDNDAGPSTNDRPEKGWFPLNPNHPGRVPENGHYRSATPLLGLYDQRKPETANQHLYWISAIGCNAICVDWTNYTSYRTAKDAGWKKYTAGTFLNGQNLLKTASQAAGFDVPKIYFAVRLFGEDYFGLRDVLDDLYTLYEAYSDVWYRFDDGTDKAAKPFVEIFIDWSIMSQFKGDNVLFDDPRWNIRYTNGYLRDVAEPDGQGNKAIPADVPLWLFVENEEDEAAGEGMYKTYYSVGGDNKPEQMVAWASIHKGGFNWDALNNIVNGLTTFERSLRGVNELSPKALIIARWNYQCAWYEEPQEGISLYESTHIEPNTDFRFEVFDNVKQNLYSLNNWIAEVPPLPEFTEITADKLVLSLAGYPVEYRIGTVSGEGEWVYYNINEGIPTEGLEAGVVYYIQTRNTFGESPVAEVKL